MDLIFHDILALRRLILANLFIDELSASDFQDPIIDGLHSGEALAFVIDVDDLEAELSSSPGVQRAHQRSTVIPLGKESEQVQRARRACLELDRLVMLGRLGYFEGLVGSFV